MLQGALAQNQLRIRGKVTDQSGAPLPGVTVTIEGTTRGVITDTDGTYSIDCKAGEKLVFSFVGMETQIIALTNQTVIDVKLLEKTEELEDVTVMAFGRAKKESVVSSISTVKPAFPKRLTRLA
ncbi:MAG: carboxypeptidase-like regulatory domain-containing protein [Calditrichaceae bacterium]